MSSEFLKSSTNDCMPVARRGKHWLQIDELRAHLAAVLRLENVGVLLGAGTSIGELGGSTVNEIWNHFSNNYKESEEWLLNEKFVFQDSDVIVENLVDLLEIARFEWERKNKTGKLEDLNKVRADVFRSIISSSLLQKEWWQFPSKVSMDCSQLNNHRHLLHKLTYSRQPGQPSPWVFTTNYDLAVEWASETVDLKVINGFDGLHIRTFSPHNFDLGYQNMLARGEARFGTYNIYLTKLHGSLTWHSSDDGTIYESPTAHIWPMIDRFLREDTNEIPCQLVFPSSSKYLQTIGFVSGELFRRFTEFLAKPQSCLITSGYSFSDEHLNRILVSALQNPTLQLVVNIPEAEICDGDFKLDNCQKWAQRIIKLELPQITVIGGDSNAYFDTLVSNLPDPALLDEQELQIQKMLKLLARTS